MKKNVIIFFTAIFVLITFWGIQSQEEVNTCLLYTSPSPRDTR